MARTHGHTVDGRTPEFLAWQNMIGRCSNPNYPNYINWGGRGITVCQEWASFTQFLEDVGPRPSPKHSLDRVDNSGDYKPNNVRWATPTEQARNRRNNIVLTHAGRTLPLPTWSEITGINYRTLATRLRRGWSAERTLTHMRGEG